MRAKGKEGRRMNVFRVMSLAFVVFACLALAGASAAQKSRVVVISSTAAVGGKINFDDLHFEKRGYAPWPAYGQSKLANQLFVRELQRRLRAAGSSVLVTAAHPGWTATDLQRSSGLASFFNP